MAGMAGRDVRMRVVLKADSHLGSAHEVVSVRRGYGRNVLVRKGSADYATAENIARHAITQQKQKEKAMLLMQGSASVETDATKGTVGVSARSAAASAASLSSLLLSPEARRYHADVIHRLSNQRPLVFVRPSVGPRDLQTLASPLSRKEVFAKLGRLHPSISLAQVKLSATGATGNGDEIQRFGDHSITVDIPGQERLIHVPIVVTRDARVAVAAAPKPKVAAL